jgi:transposase-like protein
VSTESVTGTHLVRVRGSAENGEMRSKEEILKIAEGFAKSGMTRREYCAKHGVAMTTLDYWRRAHRKQKPTLVPVAIEEGQSLAGFALVLTNGRRIESSWNFVAADLEKLIRVVEG